MSGCSPRIRQFPVGQNPIKFFIKEGRQSQSTKQGAQVRTANNFVWWFFFISTKSLKPRAIKVLWGHFGVSWTLTSSCYRAFRGLSEFDRTVDLILDEWSSLDIIWHSLQILLIQGLSWNASGRIFLNCSELVEATLYTKICTNPGPS